MSNFCRVAAITEILLAFELSVDDLDSASDRAISALMVLDVKPSEITEAVKQLNDAVSVARLAAETSDDNALYVELSVKVDSVCKVLKKFPKSKEGFREVRGSMQYVARAASSQILESSECDGMGGCLLCKN